MSADHDYIVLYRTLIEKKFMLGNGDGKLKQRDLEYLANLIEEKSRVKLSISTMKRVWRTDLHQLPHPSTLDALASVLDFKDWQEFKKHHSLPIESISSLSEQEAHPKKWALPVPVLLLLIVVGLTTGFFIIQGFNKKSKGVVVKKEVTFTADKTVTSGVPNTVMFRYDLSGVEADSFFIQQSWNPRDKVKIDPDKNYYSATYYTPGFHFARIMANDSILKFEHVHIKSGGWLPLVKYDIRDPKHIYLDTKAILGEGIMTANDEVLTHANVDLSKDFFLRYYNIRDFDGITSSNFDLETKIKCNKMARTTPTVACPLMEIMFITEQNVFFVPLTSKGCISELDMLVGEVYKSGKDNDLSAFGTEVYDWQDLRIKNQNKKTTIFLNGTPIHELEYQQEFGKIKGIIYTFTGAGAVDYLRMRDMEGNIVYSDEFE